MDGVTRRVRAAVVGVAVVVYLIAIGLAGVEHGSRALAAAEEVVAQERPDEDANGAEPAGYEAEPEGPAPDEAAADEPAADEAEEGDGEGEVDGDWRGPGDGGREPYTEHDRLREVLKFNRDTLAGAYKAHGKAGDWDEEALAFLERMAVFFTYSGASIHYRDERVPEPDELRVAAEAAIAAGCADPLVVYCYGAVLETVGRKPEAIREVGRALPALEAVGYPPHRVFAAARRLERLEAGSGRGVQVGLVVDRMIEKLPVGKLDNTQRRVTYGLMLEGLERLPIPKRVEIVKRLRARDDVDPWVLDTTDGQLHIFLAWESRGGGWADGVDEDGWAGFFRHLGMARECLTRAWKLAPELPEAPSAMIDVAMGAGERFDEKVFTWFRRAEAAQFDHMNAYARMYNALRPRWGGSHADMYELGLRAMRTRRFDTTVPWQLVVVAYRVGEDLGQGWGVLLSQPTVYQQLCRVVDGYAAAQAERDAGWYRTYRAGLAWRAGKHQEARAVLDKLGDAWNPSAFADLGSRNPPAAVGQIYALTSPQAEAVKRAEATMASRDWGKAQAEFEAARAALGGDVGRAAPYFAQRATLLGRRAGLAAGRAVDVQPDAGMTSWKVLAGEWKVGPKGELLGRHGGQKYCCLWLDEPLGGRFEFSGKAEPREHDSPPNVVLCEGDQSVAQIVFFPGTVTLYLSGHEGPPPSAQTGDARDFVVRLDGDKLTVRRGGKDVFTNFELPPHLVPHDPRIGLAVLNDVGDAAFTNLKARRITGANPDANPDAAPGVEADAADAEDAGEHDEEEEDADAADGKAGGDVKSKRLPEELEVEFD